MTADDALTSFEIDYELTHIAAVDDFMAAISDEELGWPADVEDQYFVMLRSVYRAGLKAGLGIAVTARTRTAVRRGLLISEAAASTRLDGETIVIESAARP